MATIDVKDASGSTVPIEKPNGNGRAAAANSRPMVLSTEDLAALTALATLIGEVQASPTTNTVLDRLKTIGAKDFATQTTLAAIAGSVDGLEALLAAGLVATLGSRTVAQSPAINIATDDPIAKKIGTRAYTWGSIINRTVTSTSAQTAAVGTAGEYEIATDTDCYVLVGSNPTAAATTSRFLAAGAAFTLQLASTDKVAVIRKSADGNLTVLPVA